MQACRLPVVLLSLCLVQAASADWLDRVEAVHGTIERQGETAWLQPADGQAELRLQPEGPTGRFRPMQWSDQVWYDSTFWCGGGWCKVGKNWQHPGQDLPSVRRFTAPQAGEIRITGRVRKAHLDGDGVRVAILHGGEDIWHAELEGKDDKGVEPDLRCTVAVGDAVRFVVAQRGSIACDTTYWEPVITYPDGTAYAATEAFGPTCGQENPWSYEADHGGVDLLPFQVRRFAPDLVSRIEPIKDAFAAVPTDLPVWVAGGTQPDQSILFALPHGEGDLTIAANAEGLTVSSSVPILLCQADDGWPRGLERLEDWLHGAGKGTPLASRIAREQDELFAGIPGPRPDLALQAAVIADWSQAEKLSGSEAVLAATRQHLRLAQDLLPQLAPAQRAAFAQAIQNLPTPHLLDETGWSRLYYRVRFLKRQALLAHPLFPAEPLLFAKRRPTSYSHLVMQYFGWRAQPGGGLFVLDEPGRSLRCRDLLDGQLAGGCVLEPRLSYDGKRVVFAYVDCPDGPLAHQDLTVNETGEDTHYYHIWELDLASGQRRQLTNGPYDDITPAYLPDGGIVFCSTRRRGYARCFGGQFAQRWHVYTLHRMDADGGNLRTLSWHDTNEWFPTVANSGQVLYSRWDYIDRDAVTHQNLWATRPDGTNPVALWGNATLAPHCTFQLQPIPNSRRVVCTASAHHSVTGGSLILVDPTVADNGEVALTRLTPGIPFPEAESRDIREYYAAPWPLSETLLLTAYSPVPLVWEPRPQPDNALGLYLLDAAGNRELLYRDPLISATNPVPLRARPCPPALPTLFSGEPTGEVTLIDVYRGLGDVPRGTIKELRVVQIYPKLSVVANRPPVGMAGEENARAVLGTVPVAADGSVRFTVPAQKLLCFQALDDRGRAYQVMRTATYLQPGEKVSCIGCHESRLSTLLPPGKITPEPAQPLQPESFGATPFGYARTVQPILDRHCIRCHGSEKPAKGLDLTGTAHQGFSRSYWSLCGDVQFSGGGTNPDNAKKALVPRFGARNRVQITPPGGAYGACGSRLLAMLDQGHGKVQLSPEEFRLLATWIDLNAVFFGTTDETEQAAQLRGEDIAPPTVQ